MVISLGRSSYGAFYYTVPEVISPRLIWIIITDLLEFGSSLQTNQQLQTLINGLSFTSFYGPVFIKMKTILF